MTAMIALTRECIDHGVLREGTKGLFDRSLETRIRSDIAPLIGEGGSYVAIQHSGTLRNVAESGEKSRIVLVVIEELRLQVRTDHTVVSGFEDRIRAELALNGEVEVVELRRTGSFLPLPPTHTRAIGDGRIDEWWGGPGR